VKTRIAWLTILCMVLAAVPAWAQTLYDNGPIYGGADAWPFSSPYVVSDTFTLSNSSTVGGFQLGTWEYPGDKLSSVDWKITSLEDGGTLYASGTVSGKNLTDQFYFVNQYGYNVDRITATGLNVSLSGGTYWLNLQNAVVPSGDPVYWDENSGVGCGGSDGKGANCPSLASEVLIGTVPSEAFTITGASGGTVPEPRSIMLFASGILALAGLLRRKLF
jgi:hypothetical protein